MSQKKLALKMSQVVPRQTTVIKEKLPMDDNEDTSFDIYFDIYNYENEDYLYIKLIENSAVSPFYYNKSFTLEELCEIHRIFKADDIAQVKKDLQKLFKKGLIKLVSDPNSDGIIMKLKVYLFCDEHTIDLPLYKEMIPENERDNKCLEIYNINKNQLKIGKEIYFLLKSCGKNIDRNLLNILKQNFDIVDNSNETETDSVSFPEDEEIYNGFKKTFNRKKTAHFKMQKKDDEDYFAQVRIKNYTNINWPKDSIKLIIDKNKSNILCKDIKYPPFDIEPKEDGEISFFFNAKTEPKEYTCTFDVYFNGKQLKEVKFELKVLIPQQI